MEKTWKAMLMLLAVLSTGLLAACSSDDDIEEDDVIGYWENVDVRSEMALRRSGYQFTADGDINSWIVLGPEMNDRYEDHVGKWWLVDNQLEVDFDESHNPDGLYYQIVSFSKKTLIMNVFGGFAGTPPEKGRKVPYKKLSNPVGKLVGSYWDFVSLNE